MALKGAPQGLVQGVAGQWPGQLMQRRQADGLLAGEEITIGGHQQEGRFHRWAQLEQMLQVIGDQQVDLRGIQACAAVMALVRQAPGG
ncbi:hypothetical protein D3C76_1159480 [compost metagenome]